MNINKTLKFIEIDEDSRIPKYRQIVDSIIHNISIGKLKIDQKIPSINAFSEEYYLSRDTVERAYNILKDKKIIDSIRGKGYYIATTKKLISKINVLFLINKLSSYKMMTYNSFIDAIGPISNTDLQIYHCDENLFLSILAKNKTGYDYYVIMPHFKTYDLKHISYTDNAIEAINKIPPRKIIILDNSKIGVSEEISQVYQDFETDIYNALKEGIEKIAKYKKVVLVYPEKAVYPYPRRILIGFKKFCIEHNIDFEVIEQIYEDIVLKKGDLFITIEETDLVSLVKQIRDEELILGKDIGVISYNDTPLKELLGITVISTDFKFMGQQVANMILNSDKGKVKVPFNFIDRNSL